ncbi:uncharacterized protein LOC123535181 [Mercenaria mercenaria]|uniref:uncharacterized protein LOC123535181 n=1 Tax=Mercenaria mercenaria TaxID=6596 RepID=UPI00234F9836|nr:uncharacterized protein LOC123535181 [Mercenaria mercenaria]
MICSQNARKTANIARKGHLLCTEVRELTLENARHVEFRNTAAKIMKQFDSQCREHQGQNLTCKCVAVKKYCLSFNLDRKFSTSSKCLTVTIDYKKNYYHILGVTPNCSAVTIKQAYYRLSKVYHPDVNKTKAAVEKFHEITEAYEVLSSPSLKHSYDSGRSGHSHGLHRGVVRPHPVNFTARGPHQYRNTDKYNYENWMKAHYTESFERSAYEMKKQKMEKEQNEEYWAEKERFRNRDVQTDVSNSKLSSLAIISFVFVTAVYIILKKKL